MTGGAPRGEVEIVLIPLGECANSSRIKDISGSSISSWLVYTHCDLANIDLVQSIGWGLSAHSLATNSLWPGIACDIQGFFINSGDVASSIWSLVIALHTFLLLAGGQRSRAWAAEKSTSGRGRWFFCFGTWAFIFFLGVIGPILVQRVNPDKGPFCKDLI